MSSDLHVDQLADQIAEMAVQIDAATHTLLTTIREFDHRGGWAAQGHQTCARWLSWRIGMGSGAASDYVRVANRLGELPLIDEAFRTATISYSKVRAITRVANAANEAHLVELAKLSSGAQLEVACRKYKTTQPHDPRDEADHRYVRRRALDDGMVKLEIALRPDEAAKVFALIDAGVKAASAGSSAEDFGTPYGEVKRLRPKKFDRADAFMAMIEQQVRGDLNPGGHRGPPHRRSVRGRARRSELRNSHSPYPTPTPDRYLASQAAIASTLAASITASGAL